MRRLIGFIPAWLSLMTLALAPAFHAPDALAASARQLVEVVDFGPASVSPDGLLVAFRTEQATVERNTYDTIWYVQSLTSSVPPRRLGEGGAPLRDAGGLSLREPAVWSNDGRWIFYRAEFDGRIAVWRAAVDGSRTERVTHDAGNVRAFQLSADGTSLAYSVGAPRERVADAEMDEYHGGVHIDRSVPLGDALFRSGYHEGRLATQRLAQNELERTPLLADVPDRWFTVELVNGASESQPVSSASSRALTASDLESVGPVLQFDVERDGRRVALLLQQETSAAGAVTLAMLPHQRSRRVVRCKADACNNHPITALSWRPGSDEIVFTVADVHAGGGNALFRWNVASGHVQPVVRATGEVGGGGRWSPGPCAVFGLGLACVTAGAGQPPRLERIDFETGARLVMFDPNASLARDMRDIPIEALDWIDESGQRFTGQFYPANAADGAPAPLFVVYYRCTGFLRGGVGDEWPLATMAKHGIAALCINAPTTPQEEAQARYEQGRAGVESAVALLASRGDIDPMRVGMGGLSFGAEVSMWTAMHSSLPKAVSVSTPVMSPLLRLTYALWEDVHFSRLQRFWQLGDVDETPEQWRTLSPAFAPGQVGAPVLMQMSEQEYRTSLDYAVPMIRAGRADVYVFPSEPHQKFQPRHKLAVYERNLDWFRYWLLGAEDSDARKVKQYARWNEMKTTRESDRAN